MPTNPEWSLDRGRVKAAWDLIPPTGGQTKGKGILIGHPDTGWTLHPELLRGDRYITDYPDSRNFFLPKGVTINFAPYLTGEDIMSGGGLILDLNGHGTSTASVLNSEEGHPRANPPNTNYPDYTVPLNQFVSGVAPESYVLPLRVSSSVILGGTESDIVWQKYLIRPDLYYTVNTFATLAQAIDYIRRYPPSLGPVNPYEVGVISISLGGVYAAQVLVDALIRARRAGVIVCAAGGHSDPLVAKRIPVSFPASSIHTIGVGASNNQDEAIEAGHFGPSIDICAPGWDVSVADTSGDTWKSGTRPDRNYYINAEAKGTSHAVAFVAGACALWQAYHSRAVLIDKYGKPLLLDAFKICLQSSAKRPLGGWDTDRAGAGIIDVEALLSFELPDLEDVEDQADDNDWTVEQRNVRLEDDD